MLQRNQYAPDFRAKVALESLSEAIYRFGPPDTMSNDQGLA